MSLSAGSQASLNSQTQSLLRSRAKVEIRARQAARTHLIDFAAYTKRNYEIARPHRVIAEQLERVERGEVDRLMLMVAPRHGKSELASRRYPALSLGRNPTQDFVSISATAELASDFGRDVRNLIGSHEYQALFDTKLAEDSAARGKWHTDAGGIYYSIGIGGSLLGRGAHKMLIDDPFASMEDAQSETQRKKVWDWYNGTAYNRLMPGGAIIIIGHRLHEDDLQGRLLAQQASGGDRWEVVELPAISPSGEALWPERYPIAALERIKANTYARYWSALYQQNPQPEDGTFFQREWFPEWQEADPALPHWRPKHLNIYGTSDYAVTDEGGDYTVHRIWGVDHQDNLYRLAGWRGQTSADVWIEEKINLIAKWKPFAWFGEAGVIQKAVEPMLIRRMRERKTFCRMEWIPSIHDKATRARGFQARAAMGKVRFEPGADIGEFLSFPAGKHDDEIDVASLIGRALDMAHPAILPTITLPNTPSDYRPEPHPHAEGSPWS